MGGYYYNPGFSRIQAYFPGQFRRASPIVKKNARERAGEYVNYSKYYSTLGYFIGSCVSCPGIYKWSFFLDFRIFCF
jgi:hypothetical protein